MKINIIYNLYHDGDFRIENPEEINCQKINDWEYAGTKELNEALVSRFLVIDMPAQTEETLGFIFHQMFPNARESAVEQFVGLFLDLQLKALNSEISTKALDLRGLLAQ